MNRRDFLTLLGLGTAGLVVPSTKFIFDMGKNKARYPELTLSDYVKYCTEFYLGPHYVEFIYYPNKLEAPSVIRYSGLIAAYGDPEYFPESFPKTQDS